MTRTISLIIGIAVAALVVGVPTALGEGRLAGSTEQGGVAYTSQPVSTGVSRPDSHEVQPVSTGVSRPDSHEVNRALGYEDAADRAARISALTGRDVVLLSGDDHITTPVETPAPTVSSDREVDWPVAGIGFGIGLLLSLGLFFAYRSRQRPLAH